MVNFTEKKNRSTNSKDVALHAMGESEMSLPDEHSLQHESDTLAIAQNYSTNTTFRAGNESRKYSLPRLNVIPPSIGTSSELLSRRKKKRSQGYETMTMVLSAIYAKLLIVLGVALPVTSNIQQMFEASLAYYIFSLYMYSVSVLFLCYTFYALHVDHNAQHLRRIFESNRRTKYGSFYLHMGIAGFSVGSIIYSCLQSGEYFDLSGDCQHLMVILKPVGRIIFTVAQTVFIFSYTDALEPMKGLILNRFGLMHLIATNVCEWLSVVIQETRDDIVTNTLGNSSSSTTLYSIPMSYITKESQWATNNSNLTVLASQSFSDQNGTFCNVSDLIIPLVRNANPYLRPCGVEYSLLCSIIIAVIWKDICIVPGLKNRKEDYISHRINLIGRSALNTARSPSQFSVDCDNAHRGLFMGVGLLAGTIVSLMLFFGLNDKNRELAQFQMNIWETILLLTTAVGSAMCLHILRRLGLRSRHAKLQLEHVLLLVTQCGVYLYYIFQIIGASFMIHEFSQRRRATRIIAPLSAIIQSSFQTLLILDAWSRRCSDEQIRKKPGRQLVTFLLVGNFALWLMNRVKNSRAEYHPLQMEFYGVWGWTFITHVSVPMLVCYRFQATVCFYEIWKYVYKPSKDNDSMEMELEDQIDLKNHVA